MTRGRTHSLGLGSSFFFFFLAIGLLLELSVCLSLTPPFTLILQTLGFGSRTVECTDELEVSLAPSGHYDYVKTFIPITLSPTNSLNGR